MKKEILEKELLKVLADANELKERADLEAATAEFLGKEADKLMVKMKDENTPFEQKEEISKQMDALHKRMMLEIAAFENDIPKLEALDKRMNELQLIVKTGLVEN
jgi:hypothetical protein